jgi:hypothetical protein
MVTTVAVSMVGFGRTRHRPLHPYTTPPADAHSLGDGGFVTQLEMELQGSGDAQGQTEDADGDE